MNLRREGVLRQGPCVTHRSRERPLADRQRENSSFGPQNTRDEVLPSASMSLGDFFPRASFTISPGRFLDSSLVTSCTENPGPGRGEVSVS